MPDCESIRTLLATGRAIIASGARPDLDRDEIAAANLELLAYLNRATGKVPTYCQGIYKGEGEPSLLVPVTGGFQAFAIARKVCRAWGQESVLVCDDGEGFLLSVPEPGGPVLVEELGRLVYGESPEGMTRVRCSDGDVSFHYR